MKSSHHRVNNAKAIVAFLILGIAFVIFYKFISNQSYFADDPVAGTNYVIYSIVGGGLLIGLLYLTSQTTHKEPSKTKTKSAAKSVKASKKKKK
ncbi:MAG: hypothetical protein ACR2LN_07280 [Candidatus Levyibacteriota bacterium]